MSTMTEQTVPAPRSETDSRPVARTDLGIIRAVSFGRLVRVELRKQYDTRASRWFLVSIAAIVAVLVGILMIIDDGDVPWMYAIDVTAGPLAAMLPVVAILAATSEWAQRTAITTFTLEPRRGRVIAAKILGSLLLGAVLFTAAIVLAALFHLSGIFFFGAKADWSFDGTAVGALAILMIIMLIQGSAFGLALLNTPAAIVAYFALPAALEIVNQFATSKFWVEVLSWVDLGSTTAPLEVAETLSAQQWQQLAVSVGVWVVLPLAVGVWRVLRSEVK